MSISTLHKGDYDDDHNNNNNNNDISTMNRNNRIAATPYALGTQFVSGI